MQNYIEIFANSILNLFLDQSNYLTNKIETKNDSLVQYVQNIKKEQSLQIQIFLNPKTSNFNRKYQIILLEISHQKKIKNYEGFQEFNDFINDNQQNLELNLNMLLKLFISFSFLSPYINFSNNKYSQKLSLIRKKYMMDYSVTHQQNFETMREKKLMGLNNNKIYTLKKIVENSDDILILNYQISDNINELIEMVQQTEMIKSKSSKGLRSRFLSEETGYQIYENNLRKVKAAQRFRSSLSIKQIDHKKSNLLSQILINKKPYELVDEVILKNTLNQQDDNEASLFIRHPHEVEFDIKSPEETNNSSSFFTDTNFSIRSKKIDQSSNSPNLNDLDQIPTVENIYHIFKEVQKAFCKYQFEKNDEQQKEPFNLKNPNKRKQTIFRFGNQNSNFSYFRFKFFQLNQLSKNGKSSLATQFRFQFSYIKLKYTVNRLIKQ